MSCVLWNAASLNNKLPDFLALLEDEDLDIAAVTETWMSSQQNNITAELRDNGYNIFHFNRDNKRGGGVALIFKKDFKFVSGKTFNFETFECILVSIACRAGRQVNFIVLYRYCEISPSLFLPEFYGFIDSIFINLRNVIILGDFNLHVNDKHNLNILRFCDILNSFSLKQEIDAPTHKLGNTLDLVIYDICDTVLKDVHIDFTNKSDHAYIFLKLVLDIATNSKKTIIMNDFKNVNIDNFKSDIATKVDNYVSNIDGDFIEVLTGFNNLCKECVSGHVSTREIDVNRNVRPKWIDPEFKKSRALRRRLYKRWKRTRDETDRSNFKKARITTQKLSVTKRTTFYAGQIDSCKNAHKEIVGISKNLLDKSNSSKLPTYTSPVNMATKFNDYFIGKIEKIQSSFPVKSDPMDGIGIDACNGTALFSEFNPISQDELKKVILTKPIKTSPQDPLPAVLFKACIDVLLPALMIIVNLSLSLGSMDGLKDTVITPLLKKAGLDPEVLKNFRPVCNILYLSKLIEKTVLIQSTNHMEKIKKHIPNQSGYKPKHSCETLLMRVTNDILVNGDNSKCTIVLLLDLSAAFDTVVHEILLNILWHELGFRGIVYKWFVEFLKDRRQAVGIDGKHSAFKENKFGVPQGSVVGPFLFNIYVRNLIRTLEQEGFSVHGYADDHQVSYSFQVDFQAAAIRNKVPRGMDLISRWMSKHFLKLNATKSQVIVFYPKSNSEKVAFDRLMLSDGSYIPISSTVQNLGATLDAELSYSPYISSIITQGYHLLRNVASIRKYLSVDHLKTLVNSIVVAKVDNCNSLLYGISAYNIDRLQKFQNACARVIYGKKKHDHVSGILRELHWLPSEARTYFKILCYVYKCIHDLAPSYLSSLIVIRRDYDLKLEVPRRVYHFADRAFSSAGPRLWNALPVELRLIDTLDKFKSQLKHLLFASFNSYKLKVNVYRS